MRRLPAFSSLAQDTSAPRAPLNPLPSPRLTEMFVPWVTSVLRVAGHPHPVLLAASCRSRERPLPPSAAPAPPGNTAPLPVAHSPQVWYFPQVSRWPNSCLMSLMNAAACQRNAIKPKTCWCVFSTVDFSKALKRENLNLSDSRTNVVR